MAYRITVKYQIGKNNTSADVLSQMPIQGILDKAEDLPIDQDHIEEGVYWISVP